MFACGTRWSMTARVRLNQHWHRSNTMLSAVTMISEVAVRTSSGF